MDRGLGTGVKAVARPPSARALWLLLFSWGCAGTTDIENFCSPAAECSCLVDSDCAMSACGPDAADDRSQYGQKVICTFEGWPVRAETLVEQGCEDVDVTPVWQTDCSPRMLHVHAECRDWLCVAVPNHADSP